MATTVYITIHSSYDPLKCSSEIIALTHTNFLSAGRKMHQPRELIFSFLRGVTHLIEVAIIVTIKTKWKSYTVVSTSQFQYHLEEGIE